ncbi:hypothetical protein [Nonomuraea sp. NPDC050643]|uniref:hypothetical protein n=1 Tax=Nonomuraea sp. NPDC050643 TaxID=3155660 RepID=UPI0033E41D95
MSGDGSQAAKRLMPNTVLITRREAKGWSRIRAARELERAGLGRGLSVPDADAIEKALYRHETGRAACRDPLYIELYCLVYEATQHELFGHVTAPAPSQADTFGVRSHKFVCAFIGAEQAAGLVATGQAAPGEPCFGLACHVAEASHSSGPCHLYAWPFGTAILHLAEDLNLPNIANLAIWRRRSYVENLRWASGHLSSLVGEAVNASYVLSLYWLHSPIWSGGELDTAVRIMSTPRVLLERDDEENDASLGHAELVERSLFTQGFDHAEIVPFGLKGIAIGHASWSGVVYCPLAPRRALTQEELVTTELATQAMWTYCEHINGQVEQGKDPYVPDEYGWRFLRGVRSRLTNARPQETSQHRSMRSAILETSGLLDHLAQAIDVLRESER